jgi:hypothetical protein
MSQKHTPDFYVVVTRNGQVQLRSSIGAGPYCTFGREVVQAVVQGDTVVVSTKSGRTDLYKLNRAGRSVCGPYSSFY